MAAGVYLEREEARSIYGGYDETSMHARDWIAWVGMEV